MQKWTQNRLDATTLFAPKIEPGAQAVFWMHVGRLWAPFSHPVAPLRLRFGALRLPSGALWLPFGALWLPFGALWLPLALFWFSSGALWPPFCNLFATMPLFDLLSLHFALSQPFEWQTSSNILFFGRPRTQRTRYRFVFAFC